MKYLVTGGAGFVGSYLVNKLLKQNHEVIVIDDFSMGKYKNLPVNHKGLTIYKNTILNNSVKHLYKGVDIVFHLASLTRPRESFKKILKYNKVNIEGTLKTLINANEVNVKKFIFVSSASAYGFQKKFPFDEKSTLNPASPYALTKSIGEDYCQLFTKTTTMKINVVRPFNIYGARQDPKGSYASAVSKFIDTLKADKIPFITGNGKQFRDFIYVEDVVDLLIKVSKSSCNGEVFNAGSGTHISINTLYQTISKIMKSECKVDYKDEVKEPNTQAKITKAHNFLGWKPKHNLAEGLTKTIEGYLNGN